MKESQPTHRLPQGAACMFVHSNSMNVTQPTVPFPRTYSLNPNSACRAYHTQSSMSMHSWPYHLLGPILSIPTLLTVHITHRRPLQTFSQNPSQLSLPPHHTTHHVQPSSTCRQSLLPARRQADKAYRCLTRLGTGCGSSGWWLWRLARAVVWMMTWGLNVGSKVKGQGK